MGALSNAARGATGQPPAPSRPSSPGAIGSSANQSRSQMTPPPGSPPGTYWDQRYQQWVAPRTGGNTESYHTFPQQQAPQQQSQQSSSSSTPSGPTSNPFGGAQQRFQAATGGMGNTPMGSSSSYGSGGGTYVPPIVPPDTTEADEAAFGRAKDSVGRMARSAVSSLNDELGAAGMMGSGAQVAGTRDIIRAGQGELGDVRRQQAIAASQRAQEYAKLAYGGSITQRGQDVTQRGQDIGAMTSQWLAQFNQQSQNPLQMLQLILSTLGGGL